MAKVLAVTTSMGTKWESYSQALLAFHVPEWRRVVVDGRMNWTPTGFIEHVVNSDADYIVHVDEDCFVQSRQGLLELIQTLEDDKGLVAAGVPDGGYYYREHNPAALNLFFVIFRTKALQEAWKSKSSWPELRFQQEFSGEVRRQRSDLDSSRIKWDEGEPYYPLFWFLLTAGGRFLYLREELYRSRWSSRVHSPSGESVAEHLWYLRQWFSREVMTGHDRPNLERYLAISREIRVLHGRSLKFWMGFARSEMLRVHRRLFG